MTKGRDKRRREKRGIIRKEGRGSIGEKRGREEVEEEEERRKRRRGARASCVRRAQLVPGRGGKRVCFLPLSPIG